MKILTNLKALFTHDLVKDITLPVSRIGALWDAGKSLLPGYTKGRPGHPYSQVDLVWTCVNLILDVGLSIQLMLSTADDEIIESGPAYDFLFNNKGLPYKKLFTETVGFYLLFREVYWVYTEMDLIRPTTIQVVGPHQMTPKTDSAGQLVGYEFRSGKTKIDLAPEEVFCIKNFNPDNPYRGLGPLDAGTMSISVAYQAAGYNESSLANGGRLSTILTAPPGVTVTEPEAEKMKREFSAQQGGAKNAAKVFFAKGGLTVETVSQTMADLQMIELCKYSDQKICSLFGVPPECVGLITEAQYAAGPATQRLILYGVAPILSDLAEGIDDGILERYKFKHYLNKSVPFEKSKIYCGSKTPLMAKSHYRIKRLNSLQGKKNVFAWFDVDSHPAIQEMLRQRTEKLLPLVDKGVPINQVIEAADLPFDTTKMPWGEFHWVSAGMMPSQWILDGGMEAVIGPSQPEGQPEPDKELNHEEHDKKNNLHELHDLRGEKSSRIWQKWVTSWLPLEREFKEAIRQYFRRQKNEMLSRLQKDFENKMLHDLRDLRGKDSTEQLIARIQFDLVKENGKLKVIHRTFFERAVNLGAAQTVAEVTGAAPKAAAQTAAEVARRAAIKRTLTTAAHKLQNVNKTTQDMIARQMREGLSNGEGLVDLTKRIQTSSAFNVERAGRIARTHTGSAVSAGRHEAAKHIGADTKFWLTSKDDAVRKTHREAERESRDGIPIDQPFIVGGAFLMHPGDPNGPVGEVVNCRCMELVKRAAGKSFNADYYDAQNFVTYEDFKSLLNNPENQKLSP